MINIYFVILHYQNMEDTVNCIESIDKLKTKDNANVKIILIDNDSPNKSGIELQSKYSNREDIECVLLDKNLGFSKANNIGYSKAKDNNADIILIINNDIIIEDKELIDKIIDNLNEYDIVVPDIINKEGRHQNPMRSEIYTLKKAYKNMIFELVKFIIYHIPIIRVLFYNYDVSREKLWMENYYNTHRKNFDIYNFVPYGAFIIYNKGWIKNETLAFVSNTFMYGEEDMLSLYIREKGYSLFYDDRIKIKHLEGQSTKKSNKSLYKTLIFKSKNRANAFKQYIMFYKKILRKYKNGKFDN